MSIPRSVVISVALCLLLTVVPACKRSAVEEPSPFGPASLFLSFDINVNPNVIVTSDVNETAEVRALVKLAGQPALNQLVVFTILSGPGKFEDYSRRVAVNTNANGYAIIKYVSPTKYQIGGDEWVTIQAIPQSCSPYLVWKSVDILLIKAE